jgi:predicted PurR-regulated permease PerM
VILIKNPSHRYEYASWSIIGTLLLAVIILHLVPALIAGLLVYELTQIAAPFIEKHIKVRSGRLVSIGLFAILVITALVGAGLGISAFLKSEAGNLPSLLNRLSIILTTSRDSLPTWITTYLPVNISELQIKLADFFREHATDVQHAGISALTILIQILIGMVIGSLIALQDMCTDKIEANFAKILSVKASKFSDAFHKIVFSQVKISALNTTMTGIYLLVALPLMGINLPLAKTMVLITFIVGLVPVIGNLVSNSVIVIISLSYSPAAAAGSLAYLVIIHKIEYFLNAKIVGKEVKANAWELLIAMLMMEAAFGLPGVIMAPITYAYIKNELREKGLV